MCSPINLINSSINATTPKKTHPADSAQGASPVGVTTRNGLLKRSIIDTAIHRAACDAISEKEKRKYIYPILKKAHLQAAQGKRTTRPPRQMNAYLRPNAVHADRIWQIDPTPKKTHPADSAQGASPVGVTTRNGLLKRSIIDTAIHRAACDAISEKEKRKYIYPILKKAHLQAAQGKRTTRPPRQMNAYLRPNAVHADRIWHTDPTSKKMHAKRASENMRTLRTNRVFQLHEANNSLPILQAPNDPSKSVLIEAEGPIDKITISNYYGLPLTQKQRKEITLEVRKWLNINEYKRKEYERKLDRIFRIMTPTGIGPERGRGAFAKRKIHQYEVIGPYAGALLSTEEDMIQSLLDDGTYNVLSYLFETRSSNRAIHAFNRGNVTSLVNSGHLPGKTAWANNNVSGIRAGKNLIFYVANRDIQMNEEFLIDYGPNYNPQGSVAIFSRLQQAEKRQKL